VLKRILLDEPFHNLLHASPHYVVLRRRIMSNFLKCFIALVFAVSYLTVQPVDAEELTADDYAEIHQLYARYVHAFDLGDPMAYADTYTPDGFIRVDRVGAPGTPVIGHDNLVAFAERYHENNGPYPRHLNSGLVLTPTADGAKGTCYLVVFNVNTRSLMLTGVYQDTLKKTSKGWRFAAREFLMDTPAERDE
jgi:hypothetical protein